MYFNLLIGVHALCVVVCLFREIAEATIGTVGTISRALEVFAVLFYFGCIIVAMESFYEFEAGHEFAGDPLKVVEFLGTTLEWFFIESAIFVLYFATMMI